MAYVPPHKRHSKDNEKPLLSPELPPPQTYFKQSSSSHGQSPSSSKIIYAKEAISKWFVVGSHDHDHDVDDHNQLPPSLQFRPVSFEFDERRFGGKPLILVDTHQPQPQGTNVRSPLEFVAAKVLQHLLPTFENVRSDMETQNSELEQVKPALVARFGKILFHGAPTITQRATSGNIAAGKIFRQLHRTFYTSIPTPDMEKIITGLPLSLGLKLDSTEKNVYQLKMSDANRPEATISCKCTVVKEQNKLHLYKIELNQVRHMVTDVSCLTKNLDLRLMLTTKRTLSALTDDEMQCIQTLIESAILDPNVKGGLRWPLGEASRNRFSVVGVWHTIAKSYINPSLRMKVRHADRFDFRSSMGESASEVHLKLKGILSELKVEKVDITLISKRLQDTLRLIWDHLLDCDHFVG